MRLLLRIVRAPFSAGWKRVLPMIGAPALCGACLLLVGAGPAPRRSTAAPHAAAPQTAVAKAQPVGEASRGKRSHETALAEVKRIEPTIKAINKAIWEFAEVGLEEEKSSQLLVKELESEGFQVRSGVAGMSTAFIASYGQGKPVIALLAEYDALPELSQEAAPGRKPLKEGAPGHACGHSGLGAGAWGAAVAVKKAMEAHNLKGTLRLYGTPAEEAVVGKVYMVLDHLFDDVDLCLHWHPGTRNEVWNGASKAVVSAKFNYYGVASHASAHPHAGKSALDGVELLNVGANFMREHLKPDARMHYVIVDGGGQPNVVPSKASVWYYLRSDDHRDVENDFKWLQEIAQGAAMMSRTRLEVKIETDCHELVSSGPLSQVIQNNLERLPPPKFTPEEQEFAQRVQSTLPADRDEPGQPALRDAVQRMPLVPATSQGSTDVGDVSWHVPTAGFRTTCFVANSPGHSWQNVACIGSSIGEKGTVYAAQVMACTALDLFEDESIRAAALADWRKQMKSRKYTTLIPPGQPAPKRLK